MSDSCMVIEADPSSCSSSVTGSSNDELKTSFLPNLDSNDGLEVKNESEGHSPHRNNDQHGDLLEEFQPIKNENRRYIFIENSEKDDSYANQHMKEEFHQDNFGRMEKIELDVTAETTDENKKGAKSLDIKSYLESLYQDLDDIILDSNQNPTTSNFSLNNGLLLSRIKSLNEVIQTKNLHIKTLDEKISNQRKILIDKQIRINDLESEQSKLITEFENSIFDLKSKKEKVELEYDEISIRYDKATKEIQKLNKELEFKIPPPPPPPPPPTPPRLCNLLNKFGKKNRSVSLSRLESGSVRHKRINVPMVLNKDILDSIRNRKYKLKPVAVTNKPPVNHSKDNPIYLARGRRMYHSMKHFPNTYNNEFKYLDNGLNQNSDRGCIIANILKRRVSMEYMNDSDDDDEDKFSFS